MESCRGKGYESDESWGEAHKGSEQDQVKEENNDSDREMEDKNNGEGKNWRKGMMTKWREGKTREDINKNEERKRKIKIVKVMEYDENDSET